MKRSDERSAAAGYCQLLLWSAPKSAPNSLVVDWRALQRPPGYSDIEREFRALQSALFECLLIEGSGERSSLPRCRLNRKKAGILDYDKPAEREKALKRA